MTLKEKHLKEKHDADEFLGFCMMCGVPRNVIDHLSRHGLKHYTPQAIEYIVEFALKHLPLESSLTYRPYPL